MIRNLARAGVVGVLASVAAFGVSPAFAAKPSSSSATSSIAIASVGNTAVAGAQSVTPKLGDAIKFKTTVEPLAGWEYPMVALSCYQDVNGDNYLDTNLLGPDIVFSWLDTPDATYTLGGYSSIWTVRGGGPATCHAELDAYGWKGGKQSVRVLASTGNWAAAG
jgi:hypothetical protein